LILWEILRIILGSSLNHTATSDFEKNGVTTGAIEIFGIYKTERIFPWDERKRK